MTCLCGNPAPEISLYGTLRHECQRCGRIHELVGKSVQVTTPAGTERVEDLELEVSGLREQLRLLTARVYNMSTGNHE